MLQRVVQALGLVLFVCVGVRTGAWLIEPVLPALGILFMLVVIAYWFFAGPRVKH